jgi:hypothetical protein
MTLINSDGDTTDATDDARATFAEGVKGTELSGLVPDVEFMPTLEASPGNPPRFVRVKLRNDNQFDMATWLAKVIGKDTIRIGASAVAGPVAADSCNLAPFVVCGDPNETNCFTNPTDQSCFGFDVTDADGEPTECYLKGCSGGGNDTNCESDLDVGEQCGAQADGGTSGGGQTSDVGTGNFYMLALDGTGKSGVKEAFKDGVNLCAGNTVLTEPGNFGGLRKPYNSMFGDYQGEIRPDEFPSDQVTSTTSKDGGGGTLYFDEYETYSPVDNPNGVQNKRVLSVVIADCDPKINGRDTLPVLAVGCFFATRPMPNTAVGKSSIVWGQFIGQGCNGHEISTTPSFSQKIILYKDAESGDS